MSSEKKQESHFIFLNITVAIWATVMFVLFPACSGGEKNLAEAITERDSLPSMKTLGVTTLISDSGITRYKIITEEWEIYDKKNPPYWAFEKGVYLEKFDSLFHIDASIKKTQSSLLLREKETLGIEKQCAYPQPKRRQI